MTYTVGQWFIYLIDLAVLAIVAIGLLVFIFIKRQQYQKEAEHSILAEIQLPTGWSEYYVVPCEPNAKSVNIGNFTYLLDPEKKRFTKYPMKPFLGLSWLQVPIRTESWYQDNPEPIRPSYERTIATSAEIKAITREVSATTAAMQIQEIEARQNELTKAISNQPNKMFVYIGLGACALFSLITLIIVAQLGNVI